MPCITTMPPVSASDPWLNPDKQTGKNRRRDVLIDAQHAPAPTVTPTFSQRSNQQRQHHADQTRQHEKPYGFKPIAAKCSIA